MSSKQSPDKELEPRNWKSARLGKEGRLIMRLMGRCSKRYNLIEPGDRILVGASGGKDSSTLLWALQKLQGILPFTFELRAISIDQGFGGYRQDVVVEFLNSQGIEVEAVRENVGDICRAKLGKDANPCWLCARMRRGILYSNARRLGFNKLALGHHADDVIETLLINQFYSGQLKAMPPRLRSQNGLVVIRPLALVFEKSIIDFAARMRFPTVGCGCEYERFQKASQRAEAKSLIEQLDDKIPDLRSHLLASLTNVRASHLLDDKLFGFDD